MSTETESETQKQKTKQNKVLTWARQIISLYIHRTPEKTASFFLLVSSFVSYQHCLAFSNNLSKDPELLTINMLRTDHSDQP